MKINYLKLLSVLSVFLFISCATHAVFNDLSDNKYLRVEPFPNPDSPYIGTWTASTAGTLLCIKINPDGTGKYCQNKWNGTTEKGYAKIYKETNGDLLLIVEAGVRHKITDYSSNHINTTAYGVKYSFIPGVKSANCEEFLGN